MKKFHFILSAVFCIIVFSFIISRDEPIYSTSNGDVSFYSKAPIEDIDAHSKSMIAVLDSRYNTLECLVYIRSFEFRLGKMQRDFNTRFMESEKYPTAAFKGKINETIDYSKDGKYPVTVSGTMTIHGVTQQISEKGIITVKGKTVSIASDFFINVKDFKVKIPKLLNRHIAETVEVKVKADLLYNEKITNTFIKM